MIITIENSQLTVSIKTKGAELCSVKHHQTLLEYMWSGDAAIWGKTSPVLFPIVGTLKSNTFIYENKPYTLPRHGFARDKEFQVKEKHADKVVFLVTDDEETRQNYPFSFELLLIYELEQDSLTVRYEIRNRGNNVLYFSIGGHPAFKVPLLDGTNYTDYYLHFDSPENAPRWPITEQGLIEGDPTKFFDNSNRIALTRSLFEEDALVFKNLKSGMVSLRSDTNAHGLDFHFNEFPYLGIWAARNGDFVCIEPWCGIADSVNHNALLNKKEGIEKIATEETWSRSWRVKFY